MSCRCDSCHAFIVGTQKEHRCEGCKLIVCPSCADIFQHSGDGLHGIGDPELEAERLRRERDEAFKLLRALAEELDGLFGETIWAFLEECGECRDQPATGGNGEVDRGVD